VAQSPVPGVRVHAVPVVLDADRVRPPLPDRVRRRDPALDAAGGPRLGRAAAHRNRLEHLHPRPGRRPLLLRLARGPPATARLVLDAAEADVVAGGATFAPAPGAAHVAAAVLMGEEERPAALDPLLLAGLRRIVRLVGPFRAARDDA